MNTEKAATLFIAGLIVFLLVLVSTHRAHADAIQPAGIGTAPARGPLVVSGMGEYLQPAGKGVPAVTNGYDGE